MRHATFRSNPDIPLWPKLNVKKFGDRDINGAACKLVPFVDKISYDFWMQQA